MARSPRIVIAVCAMGLLFASCSGAADPPEPSTTSTTSTTTVPEPSTTSTSAPATTSTTEAPIVEIAVEGDLPAEVAGELTSALTALNDPRAAASLPEALRAHHAGDAGALDDSYTATFVSAGLDDGTSVGVARLGTDDLLLMADDGDGWAVVGTHLATIGADPWFGGATRRVLVLGSDARPGQDPPVFRMDSIHVLTSAPSERAGAILGYPRDSWVDTDYGSMRVNALTSSGRGPDAIFDFFTEEWDVPLDGYILTGFSGFTRLMDATVGRITITIPIPIPEQEEFSGFSSGEQRLNGQRTLDFSRTRKKIPGGDFTRSYHQGIVMLAVLRTLQESPPEQIPALLGELSRFTETNLSAADLIQLGAAAMHMELGSITNEVLPGALGRASGGQSVVFLDPGFEAIVADVVDDGIRNDSGG